jgi:GWxTD domain-containing protein
MKQIAIVVLLLATCVPLWGQGTQTPIRVWVDAASYAYLQDDSSSYVEIYTSLHRADIQFEEVEGGFVGKTLLVAEISDRDGNVVDSVVKSLFIPVYYLEDAYKDDVRIFDCMGTLLAPGNYNLKLTVIDANTKREGFATSGLKVREFPRDKLAVSDIELAYRIEPVESDSIFSSLVKADRRVVPNPNQYYSNEDSLIYFYLEVYNLAPPTSPDEEFIIEIDVRDQFGHELKDLPEFGRHKPGTSAVVSEAISLTGLPGGNYLLQVKVKDPGGNAKTETAKGFAIVYAFDQLSPTMEQADEFTEEDAELMEQVIHYISSSDEKKLYKQLDLEGKKNMLARFWDERNPEPGSKINAYKNEIFRRFMYANYYFSSTLLDRNNGWRNDRGRVYITYGEPDEIERNPSAMETKPWMRWNYDRLPGQSGGDFFIFVDEDGYGNYRLMHSTLRGEISNPDWEAKLYQIGP